MSRMRSRLGFTREDVLDGLALGGALWVLMFLACLLG